MEPHGSGMITPSGGTAVIRAPRATAVAPSRQDDVVAGLSEVAGGPAGRRRRYPQPTFGASFVWGAAPVLSLAAMATMVLTQLVAQPCRSRAWGSPAQMVHLCYSDLPTALLGPDTPLSPGNWIITSLAGWLAPAGADHLRTSVDLITLLLAVCLVVLVLSVVRLAGHRPWDAAAVALCPVVVTAGMINTDLVAIALTFAGLAVMLGADGTPRSTPNASRLAGGGVLIGLAASIRPIALVALLALAVWCARTGRWRATSPVLGGAAAGLLVPNLIQLLHSPGDWRANLRSLFHPDLGYGSLLVIPRLLGRGTQPGQSFEPPAWIGLIGFAVVALLLVVRMALPERHRQEWLPWQDRGLQVATALILVMPVLVAFLAPVVLRRLTTSPPGAVAGRVVWGFGSLLVLGAVVALVTRTRRCPRLPVIMFLLASGLLLVAPVIPVQAGLWLAPMVALALPSWRVMLSFAAVECLYAAGTWLYIDGGWSPNRALPVGWYVLLVLVRLVTWAALAALAVRLSRRDELDPVRNRPDPDLVLAAHEGTVAPGGWFRDDPACALSRRSP